MFIKLGEKKYQLPDSVTIGRGEPFDVEDRSLARNHVRLIQKKGLWKIKDLGSESGTTVNGERLRAGKFRSLKLDDVILLGGVPLQIFETLPVAECTGVRKIKISEQKSYGTLVYTSFLISAGAVIFMASTRGLVHNFGTLFAVAVFFKIAGIFIRKALTRYFPFQTVTELLVSSGGVTLYLEDGTNFSIRFFNIKRWHFVGKFFFIDAYKKKLRFLLPEDGEEFARVLKNKCLSRQHRGHAVYSWIGTLPAIFALMGFLLLISGDSGFLVTSGHFMAILGSLGILSYVLTDDLRELLPLPWKLAPSTQKLGLIAIFVLTALAQYGHFSGEQKPRKFLMSTARCGLKHLDTGACPNSPLKRLPASQK